jgi:glycosyltransferase involved in cell wall biosynthesis
MKICLISNLYKPFTRGGAEKVVESMTQGLVAAGHEIFIISTKPTSGLELKKEDNINIYRFKPLNLFYYLDDYRHSALVRLFWHWLDVFNIHSALIVRKILKKEKPTVVITHNLKGIGFLLPLIIRQQKIRHLHVLHDVQLSVPSGLIIKNKEKSFLVNGWPTKIYEFVCRKLFSSPNVVISPSNWLLKFYQDKHFFSKAKTEIIHNPVFVQNAHQTKQKTNKFLFGGQLEKHKGIEWLIDVWEKNNISAELLVAGQGSLNLKTNNPKIKLLGQLSQTALVEQIKNVDFLILPSLCYENSPTMIPLSFSVSTPAIVANIGGAGELVHENQNGFRFEAANETEFLTKLNLARNITAEKLNAMQKESYATVAELNLETYTQKIVNLLK